MLNHKELSELQAGQIIGNNKLIEKIDNITEFVNELQTKRSIFYRGKMFSVGWLQNLQIRVVLNFIKNGYFWITEKVK